MLFRLQWHLALPALFRRTDAKGEHVVKVHENECLICCCWSMNTENFPRLLEKLSCHFVIFHLFIVNQQGLPFSELMISYFNRLENDCLFLQDSVPVTALVLFVLPHENLEFQIFFEIGTANLIFVHIHSDVQMSSTTFSYSLNIVVLVILTLSL